MAGRKPDFEPYSAPGLYPSFVLYADILGFTEMVLGDDARERLDDLLEALRAAKSQALDSDVDQPYRVSAFSDNLVLGWPVRDDERSLSALEPLAGTILLHASYFQLEMALRGFFVRGGLTWGALYMQPDLVYGAGLVAAYKLEQRAVFPRILVDDPIPDLGTELVKNFGGDPFSIVFSDGVASVDYLDVLNEAEDDVLFWLAQHKRQVESALTATGGVAKYYEKHEWTAAYHNFYCSTRYEGFKDLLIPGIADRWSFETLSQRLFDAGHYKPIPPDDEDED